MGAALWSRKSFPNDKMVVFVGTGLSSITPYEMNEDLFGHIVDGAFDRAAMSKDLCTDRAAPKRHMPHHFGQKLAAVC